MAGVLPTDAQERKKTPIYSGVINYFPDALIAVARVSQAGNDQHNPGQPLHWSRGKSSDHHDTLTRHLFESGTIDTDGHRHSAKMAWRALAILQLEIEASRVDHDLEAKLSYERMKEQLNDGAPDQEEDIPF